LVLPLLMKIAAAYGPAIDLRLPQEILALDNPRFFYSEVWKLAWYGYSLGILEMRSFVGHLGSLDTVLPVQVLESVKVVFRALGAGALVALAVVAWRWLRRPAGYRLIVNHDVVGIVLFFLLAMPLVLGMVAYAVYEVYSISGSRRPWGWGVQGRYFLPVYFPIFMTWFAAGLAVFLVEGRSRVQTIRFGFATVAVFLLIGAVAVSNLHASIQALVWRYFGDGSLLPAYLELVR
jgi:hypothetical protein